MGDKEYFKAIPAAYVLLEKDNKVLFLRRAGTSYYEGYLTFPSGHVEQGESLREAAARELREETGIQIGTTALRLVHVLDRPTDEAGGDTRLDFFYAVDGWIGEPVINEPEKCTELVWVDKHNLTDDIVPVVKHALEQIEKGNVESEFGWI